MHCQHGSLRCNLHQAAGFARTTTLLFHCCVKTSLSTLMLRSRQTSAVRSTGKPWCRTDGKQFHHPAYHQKVLPLFIQQRQTALQSTGKLLFFSFSTCSTCACWRFRSSPAEPKRRSADQPVCRRRFLSRRAYTVTHCATNDTTQYITTVFIGGITPSAIRNAQERMWSAITPAIYCSDRSRQ